MLLPTTDLQIGKITVNAEVAATPASRQRGLMERKSLLPNHGMLFVFEDETRTCFWMKNTPLPLSIAFITAEGKILNIAQMQPHSKASHCPTAPFLFALEMTQGWFHQNGVKTGQIVRNLPSARR